MAFTLIVEDGSIVENANSYASKEQIDSFLENEGIQPTENVYYLAAKAARKLDNKFRWLGKKVVKTQYMQWPRTALGPCNSYIADSIIPRQLITAQLFMLAETLLYEPEEGVRTDQALRRKKVGNLEIEFFDSNSSTSNNGSEWSTDVKEMLSDLIGPALFCKRV